MKKATLVYTAVVEKEVEIPDELISAQNDKNWEIKIVDYLGMKYNIGFHDIMEIKGDCINGWSRDLMD